MPASQAHSLSISHQNLIRSHAGCHQPIPRSSERVTIRGRAHQKVVQPLGRTFPSVVFPPCSPTPPSYEIFSQEIRKAISLVEDHTTEQELKARHCSAGITLEASENNTEVSTSSEFFFFFFFPPLKGPQLQKSREEGEDFQAKKQEAAIAGCPCPAPAQCPVRPPVHRGSEVLRFLHDQGGNEVELQWGFRRGP